MKLTLLFTAVWISTIVCLAGQGVSAAQLRGLEDDEERNLQGNSGNCQVLEFTRELEFGPVIVPLSSEAGEFKVVSQKSKLLVGSSQIGTVYATATIVDDSRIGQGGYTFTSGEFGTGTILFESIVANSVLAANEDFEVAIIGGTGDFKCAQGWILVGKVKNLGETPALRDVTVNLCAAKCKGA